MTYQNVTYLYIAIGGALGAVLRYAVSNWILSRSQQMFPYGTLIVNLAGCFLLGLIYSLSLERSFLHPQIRTMISVGFIGAFTTFSTFSLESINLIRNDNIALSLLYIAASVLLGLFFVWTGILTANSLNKYLFPVIDKIFEI